MEERAVFAKDSFAEFALDWVYWQITTYGTLQYITEDVYQGIIFIFISDSSLRNASLARQVIMFVTEFNLFILLQF